MIVIWVEKSRIMGVFVHEAKKKKKTISDIKELSI